jgi:hypothetical protein
LAEWIEEWKFLQAGAKPSWSQTAVNTEWVGSISLWDYEGTGLLNQDSKDDQNWNRSQKKR